MSRIKTPPGIMIYFDIMPALVQLSLEEQGCLFQSILDYGRDGVIPAFDGGLAIAWAFIQPKIDHDQETYRKKVEDAHYATYCRESRRHGEKPLSRLDWLSSVDIDS